MPVFNQSRSRIIRLVFIIAFIVIITQLANLQLISSKYGRLADENAILRKRISPPRGLIFDRKHRAILNNSLAFDLMVTPVNLKGIDTAFICRLLEIDADEFKKRVNNVLIKN